MLFFALPRACSCCRASDPSRPTIGRVRGGTQWTPARFDTSIQHRESSSTHGLVSSQKKPHPVTVLELYRRLPEVAWAQGKPTEQVSLLRNGLDAVVPRAPAHPDRELAREVGSVRATLARSERTWETPTAPLECSKRNCVLRSLPPSTRPPAAAEDRPQPRSYANSKRPSQFGLAVGRVFN